MNSFEALWALNVHSLSKQHFGQGFDDSETTETVDTVETRDVRGGAFSSGAGRGQNSAGRGGAKECVNRLIQKFENSAYIVMEIFVVYYDVLINENISSSHF